MAKPVAAKAPVSTSNQDTVSPISPAASRIYRLGEQRFAEGRYPEAVALWGHTLLQLPDDSSADALRHKLLARMGFGLLQAYGATDDPAYLEDGKEMCELYLAKHEALFGDTEAARTERGDFYELLHQFEWTLEHLPAEEREPAAVATQGAVAKKKDVAAEAEAAAARIEAEAQAEAEAEAEAETEAEAEAETEASDPEPADASSATPEHELHRFIKVRRVEWARFEDPAVMKFLLDPRDLGPSLLDSGQDVVQEPRVLVRAGAFPRLAGGRADAATRRTARRVGFAVIAAARPALQRCYEVAMSRDPILAARIDVQLTIEPDGTVRQPRLVGGSLVDAQGDVCTAEALRDVTLEGPELGEALAIAMPIQFFHQDAKSDAELTRHASELTKKGDEPTGNAYEGTAGPDPMPPIEKFAH